MSYSELPSEISLGGVYFPPLFLAVIVGMLAAFLISIFMNRYDWYRIVWHPPLFFLSLLVICTGVIGKFFIPI